MNYQETVEWMFRQLPMYQQLGSKAYRKDLTNIQKFAAHLQQPQLIFKTIHVAGTNGKGSVSHMLASVLQESGYKVGLYTSPHLRDFRERIKIGGKEISETAVIDFIEENKTFLEQENLSFFELTVGMAFEYFSKEKVDIAVIEVGLGGRLDSTNIISPELSVITNIGLDHTAILGNTLAEIAAEKAGIVKHKTPVVIGEIQEETLPVFQKIASERLAPLILAADFQGKVSPTDLNGPYQKKNVGTVHQALEVLKSGGWNIPETAVEKGLANVVRNTGLRGRWEVLREQPKVICDTAHNREGLTLVMEQLQKESFDQLHLVIGVVNDKDLSSILPLLPKNAKYYYCRPNVPRGLEAEILMEKAAEYGLIGEQFNLVEEAYEAALQEGSENDLIYVGGSTFTVAEII